jgi:hypothetical protein
MQCPFSHLGLPNFISNHPDWRAENGQSLSLKMVWKQVKTAPNEAYTRIGKCKHYLSTIIHNYPQGTISSIYLSDFQCFSFYQKKPNCG